MRAEPRNAMLATLLLAVALAAQSVLAAVQLDNDAASAKTLAPLEGLGGDSPGRVLETRAIDFPSPCEKACHGFAEEMNECSQLASCVCEVAVSMGDSCHTCLEERLESAGGGLKRFDDSLKQLLAACQDYLSEISGQDTSSSRDGPSSTSTSLSAGAAEGETTTIQTSTETATVLAGAAASAGRLSTSPLGSSAALVAAVWVALSPFYR